MSDKSAIQTALQGFATLPLRDAATGFLNALGYASERTVRTDSIVAFCQNFDIEKKLNDPKAQKEKWRDAQLIFQLTDEELSEHLSLFNDVSVAASLMQSYMFLAIELAAGDYSRSALAQIARQINRVFTMPVMVLFKIEARLSIAVINRRVNKRDDAKDVLGKVTLIQNIALASPHRGHIDILASFALPTLKTARRAISSFDALHAAWEEVFNVELLNKRFYEELANWYFWARGQVSFPDDLEKDDATRNSTSVIRLLTRLIFCWFLKEKGLLPAHLFEREALAAALNSIADSESTYYRAILQNLFFATLNQPMKTDAADARKFAADGDFFKNKAEHGVKTLYRYPTYFRDPDSALKLFDDIPFLNGGLFACLDVEDDSGKAKVLYADGFSRNPKKQAVVPNFLFFQSERVEVDLSAEYGDAKKKNAKVRGLLSILHDYKFTIAENTPVEQEIALDPELLGNVFENLLASYNPETGETARKQTGSFYTPRPIVEHMVDATLKAYLSDALLQQLPKTKPEDASAGLEILFAYTEREHAFSAHESDALIGAIDRCNILDPACGSGAYPMGILHKLVFVLGKLDPKNEKWCQRQIDKASEIVDVQAREQAIEAIKRAFAQNALDYGRKLYLIENCIYGADIQPIAIQIAKLRFFVSLICDQKATEDRAANLGIRPLPNLETKFVAADTLMRLRPEGAPLTTTSQLFANPEIAALERQLEVVRHRHFAAQTRKDKTALQKQDRDLVAKIGKLLQEDRSSGAAVDDAVTARLAWNPYDPYSVAPFFDPETMFGPALAEGFDIVIGNPPYVQIQKFPTEQKAKWVKQGYRTYGATSDIYCLFYERGVQLLREGGQLAYITSNKWMRAGYGDKLRALLANEVCTHSVIDFGMAQNFGAATTYTCIIHSSKVQNASKNTLACYVTDDRQAMKSPSDYLAAHGVLRTDFSAEPWVLLSADRFNIKKQVEAQGIPLAEWKININRGVLTGYNEAFYINDAQRAALIAEDPKCAQLIVPLLRGRDVERYGTTWEALSDEKWMINSHNGIKDQSLPPIDVPRDYPSLWRHFKVHQTKLVPRADQGDHWTNLRNCAYLNEFRKPKIIYPNMTKYLPFYFDRLCKFFVNDKAFIVTSETESLGYLTSVLNSTLFRSCFKDNFPELLGESYEIRKVFIDKIPIKKPSTDQALLFEALVPLVQAVKATSQRLTNPAASSAGSFIEEIIDACVMECYFAAHMAEKQLAITAHVRAAFAAALPAPDLASATTLDDDALAQTALRFHAIANAPNHPVRNILIRIPADSPELLGVIQREGAV